MNIEAQYNPNKYYAKIAYSCIPHTPIHTTHAAAAVQVYAVREYDPSTEERSSSHRAYQPPRPNLEALMEVCINTHTYIHTNLLLIQYHVHAHSYLYGTAASCYQVVELYISIRADCACAVAHQHAHAAVVRTEIVCADVLLRLINCQLVYAMTLLSTCRTVVATECLARHAAALACSYIVCHQ
jgi:hypothetical protein